MAVRVRDRRGQPGLHEQGGGEPDRGADRRGRDAADAGDRALHGRVAALRTHQPVGDLAGGHSLALQRVDEVTGPPERPHAVDAGVHRALQQQDISTWSVFLASTDTAPPI